MGATSKPLLTTKMSLNGKEIEVPIPQVFNEEIDDFEALKGKNGVQLTGLEGLLQKDYATQTTLAAVLAKLSDLATQTTLTSARPRASASLRSRRARTADAPGADGRQPGRGQSVVADR
jgi:hypothetical protein